MKTVSKSSLLFFFMLLQQAASFPLVERCPSKGAPAQQRDNLTVVANGELKCGKWAFDGQQVKTANVSSKEACHAMCTGECDTWGFNPDPDADEDNCRLLNSKKRDGQYLNLGVNEYLCSDTYVGTEVPLVEDGCQPELLYGFWMREFQTPSSSNAECKEICAKNPECTHALFMTDPVTSQGFCNLIKEDKDGYQIHFHSGESSCYVKEATEPTRTPGPLKCGQWQFTFAFLEEKTASSKEDCYSKCKGDCGIIKFSPYSDTDNCFLFSSRVRDEPFITEYYANVTACSTTYSGFEPKRPDGACPQIRINVSELDEQNESRVRTNEECRAMCDKNSECTHAAFYYKIGDPIGFCSLLKEDPDSEEFLYQPNESLCPKRS